MKKLNSAELEIIKLEKQKAFNDLAVKSGLLRYNDGKIEINLDFKGSPAEEAKRIRAVLEKDLAMKDKRHARA